MSLMNMTIDGDTFDVGIIKVTRKPRKETLTLGTTLDGTIHRAGVGTYFDYEVEIATKRCNVDEYDRLYEVLTDPVAEHSVTLPYGQETITIKADIDISDDSVISDYNTFRRWSSLKITFQSLEMSKVAI